MMSTLRRWLAAYSTTEIGVLGARLDEQATVIREISEDYSSFKERTDRALKRHGMRWARSNGVGGGMDTDILLQQLLADRGKRDDPFRDS